MAKLSGSFFRPQRNPKSFNVRPCTLKWKFISKRLRKTIAGRESKEAGFTQPLRQKFALLSTYPPIEHTRAYVNWRRLLERENARAPSAVWRLLSWPWHGRRNSWVMTVPTQKGSKNRSNSLWGGHKIKVRWLDKGLLGHVDGHFSKLLKNVGNKSNRYCTQISNYIIIFYYNWY